MQKKKEEDSFYCNFQDQKLNFKSSLFYFAVLDPLNTPLRERLMMLKEYLFYLLNTYKNTVTAHLMS